MADNSQIARAVMEDLFSKGKFDIVDQYFDSAYQGHESLMGSFGRDQVKKHVQTYRTAFPDLHVTVDDLVAASDKVLVRFSCRGTHRGDFLGKPGTGKSVTTSGITVMKFKNGKIVEDWTQWDTLKLLQDLGIAPAIQPSHV
jgi:steroid delta-isomerase-like uncharacterized protein